MEPISLPDLAKSYGRRARHNEEITFRRTGEILAGKKGKRRVTNKFSKSGCKRLKPRQTFEVSFTELCWTGQEVGKYQASLTKGLNASCH